MRISDWSSDVCSSDLRARRVDGQLGDRLGPPAKWQVALGDAAHKVKVGAKHIKVDGEKVDIALEYTPGDRLVVAEIDGSELAVKVAKTRTGWRMTTRGRIHDVRDRKSTRLNSSH